MTNSTKLRKFAAVAGACAALFAAAPASAYVYAMSHLQIKDLSLNVTGANTTIDSFTFNLTNTATIGTGPGTSTVETATCTQATCSSANNPLLDALVANAPGSTLIRGQNNFGFVGINNTDTYSASDSVIRTAELVNFGSTTNTEQIAESLLNVNGTAAANAEIKSNTTLTWVLTVANAGAVLTLDFLADPDLRAAIGNELAGGTWSSQAAMTAVFQLTNNQTNGVVSWSPRGSTANNCATDAADAGVACTENVDDINLQSTFSVGSNPSDVTNTPNYDVADTFGDFGITITGLAAGTYTIALSSLTSTLITREAVPEPASLALVGMALAGLGFVGNRRRAKKTA